MSEAHLPLMLAALVVGLSAVQSVFGVGLLVFGTPTLLLLGLPFDRVLLYLLPCSATISVLQVKAEGMRLDDVRRMSLMVTAPAVLIGIAFVLWAGHNVDVRAWVGAMLVASGLVRSSERAQRRIQRLIRRQLRSWLLVMGLLHGLSNLGGGLLTLIMSAVYERKEDIRRQVAFVYGLMAIIQLAILLSTRQPWRLWSSADFGLWVGLPLLAGGTFVLSGQRLFAASGQRLFHSGLTGLIIAFGVLLLFPV
jgi:hypothetical protein